MKKYLFPIAGTVFLVVGILFYTRWKSKPEIPEPVERRNHYAAVGMAQIASEDEIGEFLKNALPQASFINLPGSKRYAEILVDAGVEVWVLLDSTGSVLGVKPYFQSRDENQVVLIRKIDPVPDQEMGGYYAEVMDPAYTDSSFVFAFDSPDSRMDHTSGFPQPASVSLTLFAHRITIFKDQAHFLRESSGDLEMPDLLSADPSAISSGQSEALLTGTVSDGFEVTNLTAREKYIHVTLETKYLKITLVGEPLVFSKIPKKGELIEASGWLVGRRIDL